MTPRLRSGQAGALTYLTVRSIRNSLVLRLRRLRQPRYMLIALALALYVASIMFNRAQMPLRIPDNYESAARIAVAVVFFGIMVLSWVFATGAALQFTLAEIQFLFAAPIARRTLLQYKIVRSLIIVGGTALFFTIFIGPRRPVPAVIFALKAWVVMAILWLIEAGASLYKLHAKASDGARAQIRGPILIASFVLTGLASWTLAVFMFAEGAGELLRVVPVVVLLFFACVVWILSSDAAFEEEAAINAEKIRAAWLRVEKGNPVKRVRRRRTPYRLAPTGRVETAILWKNWLLLGRLSRRWMIILGTVIVMFIGGALFAGKSVPAREVGPFLLLVIAAFVVVMGPVMLRLDLRQDLAHLAMIKGWPVAGAAIVRGEILAPTIALSLGTVPAIILGGLFTPAVLLPLDSATSGRLAFIAAASICAVALIVAQLVIQNAVAVTFPAWIRPKAGATPGIEGMGMGMLAMYGGVLLLLLASLVPGAIAAAVMYVLGGMLLPGLVFGALLLGESVVAIEIVGRILDRTDLQEVGAG